MAYKYFSEKLIAANMDLSMIFPEKQEAVKGNLKVTYGLGEIVIYLKDITNNFKSQDTTYIDLDNAIQELINKYYKSEDKENPFKEKKVFKDTFEKGVVPTESITVKDGKLESKPIIVPQEPVAPVVVAEPSKEEQLMSKIEDFKKSLVRSELLFEDATQEEKEQELNFFRKRLTGLEILEETGDLDEFDKVKKGLIEEFIKKMS